MALQQLPPTFEPIVDDEKITTLIWRAFFEGIASGDTGTSWTPTFTGLTEVGTATKTGKYYRLTQSLAFYRITITPGTSTTAVNGTTYCDNFPLQMLSDSMAVTCSGFTAAVAGSTYSDRRIYTGSWTAITTPITIVGLVEVR